MVTHTIPKTSMCHSLRGLTVLKAFRSWVWIEGSSRTQPAANMQNDKGSGTYQILGTGTFYFLMSPRQTAQISQSQGTPPGGTLGLVKTEHKVGKSREDPEISGQIHDCPPSSDHLSFPTCHCREPTFSSFHSCPCQPAGLGEWWEEVTRNGSARLGSGRTRVCKPYVLVSLQASM